MRKLLLATAASLSTLLAGGAAHAQSLKPVAPGTILVHLNGYLQFGLDDFGSTYNTYTTGGATSKLNPVTTNGEVRLYPGFDAETIDGVEYGAQVELRTAFTNAGEGINNNATASNGNGTGGLYVRRAYGYIGEKAYGYVRFGQSDGAFTLLQDGVIETFGDGSQFSSSDTSLQVLPTKALPSAASNPFIFADQGVLYGTDKVILISPAVSEPYLGGAFSAIVSYEPNSNGFKQGTGSTSTVASTTSSALDSSATSLPKQRQNTFDGAVQYQLKDWGFNTKLSFGALDGQAIRYTGVKSAATTLKPLQVYEIGGQTTYAGLISPYDSLVVGANLKWGQALDGYVLEPKGARDALAYIVGAAYTVGPYVIGGSFFDSQTAGNYAPGKKEAHTLSEYGAAVGGNYIIGKDASLYVQYLYGHAHQPGNGFAGAGTAGTPAPTPAKNNVQVQLLSVGATLKW